MGKFLWTVVKLNKELSTKSRVMGDCHARFREKGG